MNTEINEPATDEVRVKAPQAPRRKKRARIMTPRAPKEKILPPTPIKGGKWAGVSATDCCAGCTAEACLISTINICKHPYKSADSGCGPVTIANRAEVRKLIKHQIIDMKG